MSKKDVVTLKLMRKNNIFADAFNYYVYGGKQVIHPDKLRELDTREIALPYGGEKGASQPIQKIRDIIKSVVTMMDENRAYLLLGIENQSNIHYAMPVRNMVYDALQYDKQVNEVIASHQLSDDYKNVSSDEYLSGFMKKDHLLPIVTLVIYFNSKKWDAPLSLHEMFTDQDNQVLELIPNYKVNLITPYSIADKDFNKFQSSLKEVLSFIKHANNEDELNELLNTNESFHHMGMDEVKVLNACVNAKIKIKKGEEAIDVCLAIQQMKERAAKEATQKATLKAQKEIQKAQNETKKAQKERISSLFSCINSLMEKMGWSLEQSMEVLSISDDDRKKLKKMIKLNA